MGVAFALASSLVWGTSDFLGGFYTRRLSLSAVTIVSQLAGFAALLAALPLVGALEGRALLIGVAAGACGSVGLSAFYRALATGTISIVSPVSACSALVPVALALAGGERPGAIALAGSGIALAGAVLASVHEVHGQHPAARSSIVLALVAALAIGGFLWFIGRAADGGHTFAALLGAKIGSVTFLTAGALATRSSIAMPRRLVPAVAVIGLMDTAANGLFAVAVQHGYISVVSVLGSEYPVATVLLAQIVLRERITRPQAAGVTLALVGVGMVSVT
ncbi:MAG TPA: DMT family transporter [Gaiellales bacterium]|jgi:drug/metabolite transporter (DMT)-like permease|nr:DMT family transporter [Gaiellales bacterium]